jgi:hypothetical protein
MKTFNEYLEMAQKHKDPIAQAARKSIAKTSKAIEDIANTQSGMTKFERDEMKKAKKKNKNVDQFASKEERDSPQGWK